MYFCTSSSVRIFIAALEKRETKSDQIGGESIIRGQVQSGSLQATNESNRLKHEQCRMVGGRGGLAKGPRQRFRGVQGIRVKNRGASGRSGEGA
jgi:hypothetical protein